jgi:HK97 family phage major capsid protein
MRAVRRRVAERSKKAERRDEKVRECFQTIKERGKVVLRSTERLHEMRALANEIGQSGGWLVPEGFSDAVELALFDASAMRRLASIDRQQTGRKKPFPTANDTSTEGVLLQEDVVHPTVDIAFGQITLRPYKFSSNRLILPYELTEDAMSSRQVFEMWLGKLLGNRVARRQNRAFTLGKGVSEPLGVVRAVQSSGAIVQAASQTSITGDDLSNLLQSLDPAYQDSDSSCLMAHPAIIRAIRGLRDANGRYLFPQGEGRDLRVWGFLLKPNQHMASTITSGTISVLFGDFSKYQILDARDFEVHVYDEAANLAEADQVGVQGVLRSDGTLLDAGNHPIIGLQH